MTERSNQSATMPWPEHAQLINERGYLLQKIERISPKALSLEAWERLHAAVNMELESATND